MDATFLYFGWLKSAYNRHEFAEEFGIYLAGLGIADLYDILNVPQLGVFDYSQGGEYILSKNEKIRDGYVLDFIQLRISDDKNNVRKLLQDCAVNQPEKINSVLKIIFNEIDYLNSTLDKLIWLNQNDIIEKHLNDFKEELELRYNNYLFDKLDKKEIKQSDSTSLTLDISNSKKTIKGIKLEVYNVDGEVNKGRRIDEFVTRLFNEKYLSSRKDIQLASLCFKGLDFKNQIDWNSSQNSLGYLMYQLKNHPFNSHILKSKDAGFLWKRIAECFTIKGEPINPDNLKTNKTPNFDEQAVIDSMINILRK